MTHIVATIGALIDHLRTLDQSAPITIDGEQPTALSSYRGDYSHLAIERNGVRHAATKMSGRHRSYGGYNPGHHECFIKAGATVADLIEALELSIGEEFEGYKGGQYTMHHWSDIWVSAYGDCDHLRIIAAPVESGPVDLATIKEEW